MQPQVELPWQRWSIARSQSLPSTSAFGVAPNASHAYASHDSTQQPAAGFCRWNGGNYAGETGWLPGSGEMEVSWKWGYTHSWMIYMGNTIYKWMVWGYPDFRKPPNVFTLFCWQFSIFGPPFQRWICLLFEFWMKPKKKIFQEIFLYSCLLLIEQFSNPVLSMYILEIALPHRMHWTHFHDVRLCSGAKLKCRISGQVENPQCFFFF